MATLPIRIVPDTGLVLGTGYTPAAAAGDAFPNSGQETVLIKNAGAGSVTVTVPARIPCNHGVTHDLIITIAAGAEMELPKLPPGRFNTSNTNMATITYSSATSVSVQVIRRS